MKAMRCKVKITEVTLGENCDQITARPVCKQGAYPALLGVYRPGQEFYVDWTPVEASR